MSAFVWKNVCLKFGAYYITGERGKFIIKMLLTAFMNFDHFFIVFYHRICIFIIFISFFDKVSNFRNIILTNQKHELVVSYCQWNCMKYMVYQDWYYDSLCYFSLGLFPLSCGIVSLCAVLSQLCGVRFFQMIYLL